MPFSPKTIAVVSPSGISSEDRLSQGLSLIESWGHQVNRSPYLNQAHLFFAGTVEQRTADLKWCSSQPKKDVIWFARGGYGTTELLETIDYEWFENKTIIGFSDATALLSAVSSLQSTRFVHGPVLHSIADLCDETTQLAMRHFLENYELPNLPGTVLKGHVDKPFKAPLTGGNLCVLASLTGTPWQLSSVGKIVVLEDIGEPPYKIHRMLRQLVLSGCFEGVKGIAFGDLTGSKPPSHAAWSLTDCILDALRDVDVPVLSALPIGHSNRNLPWENGRLYRFQSTGLYVE